MTERFSLDLSYIVKYETERYIPLNEIIKALGSLEILLGKSDKVVAELLGIEITGQELYVKRLESGSLLEDILVKLIFKDRETLDKAIEKLRDSKMKEYLIGAILGGALLYGYTQLTQNNQSYKPSNTNSEMSGSNVITGSDNSNIFNFHGDVIDSETKDVINETIRKNFSADVSSVARQTINFFEPVRDDQNASISLGSKDVEPVVIPREVIDVVPERYTKPANKDIKELKDVRVSLRAKDQDSHKSGWGGVVENVGDFGDSGIDIDDIGSGRIAVILDPVIDPEEIYGRDYIYADVSLERRYNKDSNDMQPTRIIIRQILDK